MNAADTSWILTATALVLLMTLPGLGLFYAGLVQAKNILSVLMQCIAIACFASVFWVVCGYSLAFSEGSSVIGGMSKFMLFGVDKSSLVGTLPESLFLMFQMTFAIITPALMVGAFVERIKFSAVVVIALLWLLIVYAPVTHWVWGGGWLQAMGVMDFAGGIVVHVTAGVSAAVIACMLGGRIGFPSSTQPPHAPWMVMVGASLLWVGWFGFNAGSAVAAGQDAGMAMLVTHISAAVASLVWLTIEWVKFGKPSLIGLVTGTIAGLATVTPASGFIGPSGAILLGLAGGMICYVAVDLVKSRMKIDDSLDVLAVHGVGGATGTLMAALLAVPEFGGSGLPKGATVISQFGVQLTGVVVVAFWAGLATIAIVYVAKAVCGGIRVAAEEETEGLDYVQHGEVGYRN